MPIFLPYVRQRQCCSSSNSHLYDNLGCSAPHPSRPAIQSSPVTITRQCIATAIAKKRRRWNIWGNVAKIPFAIRNWDCAKTEPRTKEQFVHVDVFETSGFLLVLLVLDNHIECSWWSENLTQSKPRWDQINSWQRLKMNVSSHSPICIGNVTAWMDQQRINGHPKGVLKYFEKSWTFFSAQEWQTCIRVGSCFQLGLQYGPREM